MKGDRERARIVAAVQVLKLSIDELNSMLNKQAGSATVLRYAQEVSVDANHVLTLAKAENTEAK